MNGWLTRPITLSEERRVAFSINGEGAPSEDVFTAKFFENFWDIVGGDVFVAIRSFFFDGKLL